MCVPVCTYASVCSDMESYLHFLWYAGIYESYGNLFKILIFFPSEVSIAQSYHCIQELYFEARDEELETLSPPEVLPGTPESA